MLIHVEDHDAYQAYKKRYKGREDECLYPTSMIRQLRWFFQTFQTYLQKWAEDFAKDINAINTAKYLKEREEAADPRNVYHARSYTVQDAMSSILDTLGISYQDKRTQQMICEAGFRPDHAKKPADSWEAFLDAEMRLYRYFVSGYSLTEFENRDDHRERTELTYFSKPRTSEYRLLELAKETMVIGLSATARLPCLSCRRNLAINSIRCRMGCGVRCRSSIERWSNLIRSSMSQFKRMHCCWILRSWSRRALFPRHSRSFITSQLMRRL